jgi:hypothetical protein
VTPAQAARLLGIRLEHAVALLTDLERENFLAGTARASSTCNASGEPQGSPRCYSHRKTHDRIHFRRAHRTG